MACRRLRRRDLQSILIASIRRLRQFKQLSLRIDVVRMKEFLNQRSPFWLVVLGLLMGVYSGVSAQLPASGPSPAKWVLIPKNPAPFPSEEPVTIQMQVPVSPDRVADRMEVGGQPVSFGPRHVAAQPSGGVELPPSS